ncbi:hypothetical protein [Chelatococcus reniformis]|uniref:Uncharacterized protein n=1 Tax=Chelatococcus reniformis TaxID=1494448 RepID=A0A916U8I3_9HYPH|nr:hypothetical protein [Chelatococcus reniformis]GGC62514.1 hypothetical protein GCM10010994_21380 [Chelatococcus reniformis]
MTCDDTEAAAAAVGADPPTRRRAPVWRERAVSIAVAGLIGSVVPAAAMLPPRFYEQARQNAVDVVVIRVAQVGAPPEPTGFGPCAVTGTVLRVERGTAHRAGERIVLQVPCARLGARAPIGPVLYQPIARLRAGRYARAYLDAHGLLTLSQYRILRRP